MLALGTKINHPIFENMAQESGEECLSDSKRSSKLPFNVYSVIITGLDRFLKSNGLYPINFKIDG